MPLFAIVALILAALWLQDVGGRGKAGAITASKSWILKVGYWVARLLGPTAMWILCALVVSAMAWLLVTRVCNPPHFVTVKRE